MTLVELTGDDLTIDDVVAVARDGARVRVSDEALARVRQARDVVERVLASGQAVYGLNTGVGTFYRHRLSPESREHKALAEMIEHEKIMVAPLAYIRGRSLDHVFFIVDEAQNLTPHEVKTIITRAGEGSKVVFTGDIHQIDTPYLDSQSNGLTFLVDRMKDQELFAHVNLVKGERSHLAELASTLL